MHNIIVPSIGAVLKGKDRELNFHLIPKAKSVKVYIKKQFWTQ